MIEIHNVTKQFYSLVAINGVSLKIPQGEVVGLLGPNGAGKTTLFKLIAGFLQPNSGQIRPTTADWPAIGYKPDRLLFPNHMRVKPYLEMTAAVSNIPRSHIKQVVADSLERMNLTQAAGKKIKDCSKGMRQRLALAQAIIGDPPLLLLDEPSNGLDPEGQVDICRVIQELQAAGKTILISSHQLHEVTQVCTYLVILNQGQILYENRMSAALQERPHTTIRVNEALSPISDLLHALHPDIEVNGHQVILNNEAMRFRRHVLSILLGAGYDILQLDQKRVTLAEIYAETLQ